MMWFTSDLHFGHKNVLRYDNRPYKDIIEMEESIIANWNDTVKKDSEYVYVLGDVFFCGTKKAQEIMSKLNGYKILVCGNHDRNPKQMLNLGFDEVYENHRINLGNHKVLLSHFPYHPVLQYFNQNGVIQQIIDPNVDQRYLHKRILDDGQTWLLHGHSHTKGPKVGNRTINVGCMHWNYKPVGHERLLEIINGKRND